MARKPVTKEVDPSATAESLLEETDIGQTILKYKKEVVIGIIVIFVSVLVSLLVKMQMDSSSKEKLNIIHKYTMGPLKDFSEDKMNKEEFVKKFNKYKDEVKNTPAALVSLINTTKILSDKGLNSDAINSLKFGLELVDSNDNANYIISSNLAVLYEQEKKYSDAINVLEELTKRESKVYETRTYLDLGRLYKLNGNLDKAKLNLEYVVNNFPNDDMAKLAKLYLGEIK